MSGVESKGEPGTDSSILSAAAIECLGRKNQYHTYIADADTNVAYDASSATTASGPKPASPKRSRMHVTLSAHHFSYHDTQKTRMARGSPNGSGTVPSFAGPSASGRPRRNGSRGAPGQLLNPTAAAN